MDQVTVLEISTNVVEVAVPGPQGPTGPQGIQGPVGSSTWASITSKPTTVTGFGITDAEKTTNKGVANGYAGLDGGGKVPAAQLPSYVDDVLEYANLAAFPGTGSTGIIYVADDTGKIYRWSGSAYIEISPSPGSTDSVTEGSTNLYFTATRVLASVLAGFSTASSAVVTVADTVLSALGKLQAQISSFGTAATQNTGTSGANVPLLNGNNAWSGNAGFGTNAALIAGFNVAGSSTIRGLANTNSLFGASTASGSTTAACVQLGSTNGNTPFIAGSMYGASDAVASDLVFMTNATERFRLTAAGALNFATNVSLSFAGTGAATTRTNLGLTAAATMTAVAGTFTPTLTFGGNSVGVAYSMQSASYVRIGRMVYVRGQITLTSKGSSTGNAQIGGLPLPAAAGLADTIEISFYSSMASMTAGLFGSLSGGASAFTLYLPGTTLVAALQDTNFTNSSVIYFAGMYDCGSF